MRVWTGRLDGASSVAAVVALVCSTQDVTCVAHDVPDSSYSRRPAATRRLERRRRRTHSLTRSLVKLRPPAPSALKVSDKQPREHIRPRATNFAVKGCVCLILGNKNSGNNRAKRP
ncbi:hypothetical protein PHYPSEUDO_002887 [Phytophthora pseudosyringae]|uniref:Secreted protein n=1 Tax=Phytophthora pseudosyringae TaxID=221518 RepID=A0A8T1VW05_9STRA|nr:hypothetical protein PHYPSEUDO_002887 [Phytophthora pseudosyringae]